MTSTALTQHSSTQAQPWIKWTNLTLGAFLAASPWLALGGDSAVTRNAVTCGAIVAIAACVALSKPSAEALAGAQVVVDVANSPSFDDKEDWLSHSLPQR